MAEDGYIHGTEPDEQRRLADLNAILNDGSLAALAPRDGEHMLEVGSGLGHFARAVARVTGVPVVGVERSAAQLARCSGEPAFPAMVANLIDILVGARAAILGTAGCDQATFDAAIGALRDFARRSDAALWYSVSWAEAIRP